MKTPASIACIIVTFNRKLLLLQTLHAVLQQRVCPTAIFIIDNASTDGTSALLQTEHFIADAVMDYSEKQLDSGLCLYYMRLATNIGGAGGFHTGMQQAFTKGYTWFWLLDDDACPEPQALFYLCHYLNIDPQLIALASSVWGEDQTLQLAHRGHFHRKKCYPYLHTPLIETAYQRQTISIDMASFVGLLIKRVAVEQVGLPKREFFIHHDDVEYCLRLKTVGKILLVPASKIIHKDSQSQVGSWQQFLGYHSRRIPLNRLWIFYFSVRNAVYLGKQQLSGFHFITQSIFYFLKLSIGILIYDTLKKKRLHCLYQAFKDGYLANFENTYPFELKNAQFIHNNLQID